jgi:hypothetical protein
MDEHGRRIGTRERQLMGVDGALVAPLDFKSSGR